MERHLAPIERMDLAALGQFRHGMGSPGLEPIAAVLSRQRPPRPATLWSGPPAMVSAMSGELAPAGATAHAESSARPPTKTVRRRKSTCFLLSSREFQSCALTIVWWRGLSAPTTPASDRPGALRVG